MSKNSLSNDTEKCHKEGCGKPAIVFWNGAWCCSATHAPKPVQLTLLKGGLKDPKAPR